MTAAIILAAGESSRLGFPKQNLLYKGKTLLEWVAEAALKAKCSPIIVVLGANADKINTIAGTITLINNDWEEGMSSSIRVAIKHIEKDSDIDSVIMLLCDQPFVNQALITSMIYKPQETGKTIVACSYKDTIGVPVLFKRSLLAELLALQGKEGAKKILDKHPENIVIISFEKGGIDIDTIPDYEQLLNLGN